MVESLDGWKVFLCFLFKLFACRFSHKHTHSLIHILSPTHHSLARSFVRRLVFLLFTFVCSDNHIDDVDAVTDVVEGEPEGRAEVVQLPKNSSPYDHDPVVQQRRRHYEQPLWRKIH